MPILVESKDLPTLKVNKPNPYVKGDVLYPDCLKEFKDSTFNLYHGGFVRFGAAGLHWTPSSKLATIIANNSANKKVLKKAFNVSDVFIRLEDEIEVNTIYNYASKISKKAYDVMTDIGREFLTQEPDYVHGPLPKSKRSWELQISMLLVELTESSNTKKEQTFIDSLYVPLVKVMKSKNIRGFVYYNEIEGGGDSFITLW